MSVGPVTPSALQDLLAAISDYLLQRQSFDQSVNRIREIGEIDRWTWLGLPDKRQANWNIGLILRTCSYANYITERMEDLRAFPIWVYRSDHLECLDRHAEIDGLMLSSDNAAWSFLIPPLSWECGCHIVGARSESGAVRIGADPTKSIPSWVFQRSADGAFGTDPQEPSEFILGLIQSIAAGEAPAAPS